MPGLNNTEGNRGRSLNFFSLRTPSANEEMLTTMSVWWNYILYKVSQLLSFKTYGRVPKALLDQTLKRKSAANFGTTKRAEIWIEEALMVRVDAKRVLVHKKRR